MGMQLGSYLVMEKLFNVLSNKVPLLRICVDLEIESNTQLCFHQLKLRFVLFSFKFKFKFTLTLLFSGP